MFRLIKLKFFILIFGLLNSSFIFGQKNEIIKLPEPQKNIGKPLMQVLEKRQSSRNFIDKEIPMQELSNILWAGFGINRPESGKRTAPSAMNRQEIDIYLSVKNGVFLYDAKNNSLIKKLDEDIRALTGKQDYVKDAAVNLIFVADISSYKGEMTEYNLINIGADAGFIAENIYLYCASEGLGVVVRANIDKEKLAKKLNLNSSQKIVLAQSIGYTK